MPDIGSLLEQIRAHLPGGFRVSATSVATGMPVLPQRFRGGPREFIPRADRWFGLTVEVDHLGLPTLPERMEHTLHERLVENIGVAADKVIETAQSHLYKPADFPVHRHGVDTGLLKRTLVARLVDEIEHAVFYDFFSTDAAYWVFVEFGRLRPDGSWWPGYHYLTSAVMQNYKAIQNAARVSVHETFTLLAAEARVPSGRSVPLPPSVASLGPVSPGGTPMEQAP